MTFPLSRPCLRLSDCFSSRLRVPGCSKAPEMTPRVVRSPANTLADGKRTGKIQRTCSQGHEDKPLWRRQQLFFPPPVPPKSFLHPDWIGERKHSRSCCFGVCRKKIMANKSRHNEPSIASVVGGEKKPPAAVRNTFSQTRVHDVASGTNIETFQ